MDTPDPTILWLSQFNGQVGSSLRGYSFTERGTVGYVGISIGRAVNAVQSGLNGDRFADLTSEDYVHNSYTTVTGNAVKVRLPVASQIVTLQDTSLATNSAEACDVKTGPLPCGYGAGAGNASSLNTFQAGDQFSAGKMSMWLNLFRNSGTDEALGDASLPANPRWLGTNVFSSGGGSLTAQLAASAKSSVTGSYALYHWSEAQNAGSPSPTISSYGSENAWARYDRSFSRASSASLLLQQSSVDSQGGMEVYGDFATSSRAGNFAIAFDGGRVGTASQAYPYIDDPTHLTYYCQAHMAVGNGPWAASPRTSISQYTATWHRRTLHYEAAVRAYTRNEFNSLVGVYVPGSDLQGLFGPTYVDQANALLSTGLPCGVTAPLSSESFFFHVYAAAPIVHYAGVRGMVRFDMGHGAFVQPYFDVQSAYQRGLASQLSARSLTPLDGEQLPGIARDKFGLFADADVFSHAEAIANWSYTGANNGFGPKPFSILGAAIAFHLRNGGQLTVSADNLLNTRASQFATPSSGSLAINGVAVPMLSWPLPARQVSVRFDLRARRPLLQPDANNGNLRLSVDPLPGTPPPEPFAVNRAAESCTPENLARAQRDLDALSRYVLYVLSQRASHEIPRNRTVDGITFTYRLTASSFAVGISSKNTPDEFPMLRCSVLHEGSIDALHAAGVYIPSKEEVAANHVVWYAKPFGLYVVNQEVPTHSISVKVLPLPLSPPVQPLQLASNDAVCKPYLRSAATSLVSALQSIIEAWRQSRQFDSTSPWQVVEHGSYATGWLQLSLPSEQMGEVLGACVSIHGIAPAEANEKGINGSPLPKLNFSRAFGLYVLSAPTP